MKRYFIFAYEEGASGYCMDELVGCTDDIIDALRGMMKSTVKRPFIDQEAKQVSNSHIWDWHIGGLCASASHYHKIASLLQISNEDEALFRIGYADGYEIDDRCLRVMAA